MNIDLSKKLITAAFSMKKGAKGLTLQDFISTLSFKKNLLDPETVTEFVKAASNANILVEREDLYIPNFSVSGIIVPLDFSVTREELFSSSVERPVVDRILDSMVISGKFSKKEIIEKAREIMSGSQFMTFEIALLALMSDLGYDTKQFCDELLAGLRSKHSV